LSTSAAGVTVGVDLGGTKIQSVALRGRRRVGEARSQTPRTNPGDVIAAIVQSIHATDVPVADIVAIGIGSPGAIDPQTGAVTQARNLPGFDGTVELATLVSKELGRIEVRVDNDVRSALLGEYRMGAGRPFTNVLAVFVGTGVGGGLIVNRRLYEGRGASGEIGHVVVKPGGRVCSCGRRGCLEAYAGRGQMEIHARKLVRKGRKTVLFELMKKRRRDRITSGVLAEALEKKDRLAEELIEEAVQALGVGIASAQNLVDAEAVIIGGGLGDRLGAPFAERVKKAMMPHLFGSAHPPEVLNTVLGDLAGATGAALIARNSRPRL
jgi:glucokinase